MSPLNKKIGILGGGQLGLMMAGPAKKLGVELVAYDPDPECPCASWEFGFVQGSLQNEIELLKFGQSVDIITAEFEHINSQALRQLQKLGKPVFPQPDVLAIIQDKGLQNQFYEKNEIPTPEFILINSKEELRLYPHFLPAVQKLRRFGYDSKGIAKLKNPNDFALGLDGQTVLEKWVNIQCEISVLVARKQDGEMAVYPPVELIPHPYAFLLDYAVSPARISVELSARAQELAKKVATAFNIVGLLAVECFVTQDQEILVNESAPRPHNSGHASIEGNVTSQFEQHLRAILGLPLGSTAITQPAIMKNILGTPPERWEAYQNHLKRSLQSTKGALHWYNKKQSKLYRKMGHYTVLDKSVDTLQSLFIELDKEYFK